MVNESVVIRTLQFEWRNSRTSKRPGRTNGTLTLSMDQVHRIVITVKEEEPTKLLDAHMDRLLQACNKATHMLCLLLNRIRTAACWSSAAEQDQ